MTDEKKGLIAGLPGRRLEPGDPPPPEAIEILFESLFHSDTDTHISRLLGVDKRVAGRMRTGYTTVNPRLYRKLLDQEILRDRVMKEIAEVIERAAAEGLHTDVLRYALVGFLKTDRMHRDDGKL